MHRFVPASGDPAGAGATTLLLLHGTGGDEEDMLALGRRLLPGAALLSPRGRVLEGTMPRFFRRHAEGVLDQDDLRARTEELATFVDRAAAAYGVPRAGVIAAGFSNGANIAASLLLRKGAVLRGAVLLSPMLPFEPPRLPDLAGVAVFVGAGRADPMVPAAQVERLAGLLREAGAEVTVHWHPGGHGLTPGEVDAARDWATRVAAGAPRADSASV